MIAELAFHPWCLDPDILKTWTDEVIREKARSVLNPQSPASARQQQGQGVGQRVTLINIFGTLMPRGGFLSDIFGGANYRDLSAVFHEVAADSDVEAIILNID